LMIKGVARIARSYVLKRCPQLSHSLRRRIPPRESWEVSITLEFSL